MFDHNYDLPPNLSPRLETAARQILFARRYTKQLLADLADDDWFDRPEQYDTHIAWQVGHIAVASYGLTLFRQRGRADVDSELMSGAFRKKFMKGTSPPGDDAGFPTPTEIIEVLDRVLEQTMTELPDFEATLDEPGDPPHAGFGNRYGSLLFAAHHEMLHSGQIGMLRRLAGKKPLR